MSAEVWLGALQLCLQPSVILFLCIGVCIGTVIGALPGLSATMGIAIMTPITFWFEPADGFAMLMGLWNAAIFAGGISAILVNTPGTPASIIPGNHSPALPAILRTRRHVPPRRSPHSSSSALYPSQPPSIPRAQNRPHPCQFNVSSHIFPPVVL